MGQSAPAVTFAKNIWLKERKGCQKSKGIITNKHPNRIQPTVCFSCCSEVGEADRSVATQPDLTFPRKPTTFFLRIRKVLLELNHTCSH